MAANVVLYCVPATAAGRLLVVIARVARGITVMVAVDDFVRSA